MTILRDTVLQASISAVQILFERCIPRMELRWTTCQTESLSLQLGFNVLRGWSLWDKYEGWDLLKNCASCGQEQWTVLTDGYCTTGGQSTGSLGSFIPTLNINIVHQYYHSTVVTDSLSQSRCLSTAVGMQWIDLMRSTHHACDNLIKLILFDGCIDFTVNFIWDLKLCDFLEK